MLRLKMANKRGLADRGITYLIKNTYMKILKKYQYDDIKNIKYIFYISYMYFFYIIRYILNISKLHLTYIKYIRLKISY